MTVYCPCCGYDTLTAAGNYEVCPICFWEDVPTADTIMRITSNHVTLLQAQRNFLTTGACEADYLKLTRPSTAADHRPSAWQPLDQRLRQQQQALLTPLLRFQQPLLTLLAPLITDEMLRTIADADYGMNIDAHLAALRRIHAGEIWAPLAWEPREVLELVRWSEPDDPNSHWNPKMMGQTGHRQRSFACTALLLAAALPENRPLLLGGENATIIQLIASLLTLDETMQRAGARLLSARMIDLDLEADDRPFFALGILLLAATLPDREPAHLADLAAWVLAEETRSRDKLTCFAPWQQLSDQWLLGLTNFNTCHDRWQTLTVRLLGDTIASLPSSRTTPLQTIVERMQS